LRTIGDGGLFLRFSQQKFFARLDGYSCDFAAAAPLLYAGDTYEQSDEFSIGR
jgi:hypothetical protein